ncbi:MAG: hypothetical protein PVH88_07530 [Ignavibacteria bacterium]|jgi:hypothetical protein
MKPLFIFAFFFFLFVSCSKEETPPKLELSNSNVAAFYLNPGWELNASFSVKGFVIKEENKNLLANLIYYVNLITPESDTIKSIDYGTITKISDAELGLISIESQIELDKDFLPGEYKLLFFAEDNFSGQYINTEKLFFLSVE